MNTTYDIAVVGSGFGGSLLAMIARRLGRSVILLEKGQHPRFAIGESSTPLSNILLEQLATRYDCRVVVLTARDGAWNRDPFAGDGRFQERDPNLATAFAILSLSYTKK